MLSCSPAKNAEDLTSEEKEKIKRCRIKFMLIVAVSVIGGVVVALL